jgi:hypothetical protein
MKTNTAAFTVEVAMAPSSPETALALTLAQSLIVAHNNSGHRSYLP